jgi:hypothetical protein
MYVDFIAFHLISVPDLMKIVKPCGVCMDACTFPFPLFTHDAPPGAVPDEKIMVALAYQADPSSVPLESVAVVRSKPSA